MDLIGLTGGVGMGKTTAADLLGRRGIKIIDTDAIAREVVEPGQPALVEIQNAFGAALVGADGRLRRADLARMVFADDAARHRLESILHPRIRQVWQARVAELSGQGQRLAVVVIPLLFETDAAPNFTATVCVACSMRSQHERLSARGWTPPQIEQRIRAQWPIEKKIAAADFVLWTEGPLAIVDQQWDRILAAKPFLPAA